VVIKIHRLGRRRWPELCKHQISGETEQAASFHLIAVTPGGCLCCPRWSSVLTLVPGRTPLSRRPGLHHIRVQGSLCPFSRQTGRRTTPRAAPSWVRTLSVKVNGPIQQDAPARTHRRWAGLSSNGPHPPALASPSAPLDRPMGERWNPHRPSSAPETSQSIAGRRNPRRC